MDINARDLLHEIVDKERNFRKRMFLAPYTSTSSKAIVKVDGINYPFNITGFPRTPGSGGIGIFRPRDAKFAHFVRDAEADIAREYLDILPFVYMILAFETELGWVAYPMNLESSKRKIGLDCEIIVRNVTDVERFDTVTVRYDGLHFWFDEIFPGADMIKADQMRTAFTPDTPNRMKRQMEEIPGITPEELKTVDLATDAWLSFKKVSTEDRIREALEQGGGKLGSYVIRGKNIEINWQSRSGEKYTSVVEKGSLDALVPGICVAAKGEDPHGSTEKHKNKFHLADLPYVVAEGERQRRIVRLHRHHRLDMDDDVDEDFDE